MSSQRVLVVSEQPVVSQGLKLIIESAGAAEVAIASDEATASSLVSKLIPSIVVVDREEDEVDEPRSFLGNDYPVKLVLLSPSDDRMVVYSRQEVNKATLENLLNAIRKDDLSTND